MTATPLGPGSEFDLIRTLLARWGVRAVGIGDDAAIVQVPRGEQLVVSTDTSVEDVHFRAYLSPSEIGQRATAAALSDLAAMAAAPLGLLLALTVPERWRARMEQLADGVGVVAAAHGVPIVGGDISRGERLVLTVTVLGSVWSPLRRDAVRPGDTLYVTGRLGAPAAALAALERGDAPSPDVRERFVRPTPRLREGRWLAAAGAHAAIDVSDGLAADLAHLAAASAVRISLEMERVPCWPGTSPTEAARSGEEYELVVAAARPLDVADFEAVFGVPLTAVAHAEEAPPGTGGSVAGYANGARVALPSGHDHFSG